MRRFVFILLTLILFPFLSYGQTTYFVDGVGTGDTLETIAEVNALSLVPGDSILFKRGVTWNMASEFLYILYSGTAGNLIVFADYGVGAKPIFDGTGGTSTRGILFGNWNAGNNIRYVKLMNLEVRDFEQQNIMGAPSDTGSQYITMENIHSHHSGSDGIMMQTSANTILRQLAGNYTLTNCLLDSNDSHGIKLYGNNSVVTNCTAAYNGQDVAIASGLQLPTEGAGICTVRNSIFHDNSQNGIRIARHGGGAVIENCQSYNNQYGFRPTEYAHNVVISNCKIYDNSVRNIWIRTRNYNVTVKSCTLYNSGGAGIMLENGTANVWFKDNLIYNNDDEGIHVKAGGIGEGNPDSVYVIGNYIYNNGDEGLYTAGTSRLYVVNNTFHHNDSVGGTWIDVKSTSGTDTAFYFNNVIGRMSIDPGDTTYTGYNCFSRGATEDVINWNGTDYTLAEYQAATDNGNNSVAWYPDFVDTLTYDFSFDSTSAATDSGRFTATALVTETSHDTLKISGYCIFKSAFQLGGVSVDTVKVGESSAPVDTTVKINDTLAVILQSAISWNANDNVSLPYSRIAPDIGAFEVGGAVFYPAPVANFSGTPTSGDSVLTVQFTDASSYNPISWLWQFGDGDTSLAENPSHDYDTVKTYSVTLTATNITGSDDTTRTNYITITSVSPPTASFYASPLSGDSALTVQFTDSSYGDASTSWSWDFGDEDTSLTQSPSHIYDTTGTFSVTLTASNFGGSDDTTRSNYITATSPSPPIANFSGTPTNGDSVLSVTFTDLSSNSPISWLWEFGDEDTSIVENPSHNYDSVGVFTVTLTVTNAGGSDDTTRTDYITVNAVAGGVSTRDSLSVLNGNSDGRISQQLTNVTWTTLSNGSGNATYLTTTAEGPLMYGGDSTNLWDRIYRIFLNFNGKDIPSDIELDSAFIYLDGASKTDGLGATPAVGLYPASPASDVSLGSGDYDSVSDSLASDSITYANWSTTDYNKFTLNTHGLNHIDSCITATDSTVCFAIRTPAYDVVDVAPNWVEDGISRCVASMSESTGNEPYLITYYTTTRGDSTLTRRVLEVNAGQRKREINIGVREKIVK